MTQSRCSGAQVCAADPQGAPCRESLAGTGRDVGHRPDIPVRRYGNAPEEFEEEFADEFGHALLPRTIGERGATAVFLAAVSVACVAGYLLYA